MSTRPIPNRSRRGTAAVAAVALLLILNVVVVGLITTSGRDQSLTARRMETIQAFYAAEAGINMAVRELLISVDEDGDGTIGGISSDGNAANDPSIGAATVSVSLTTDTVPDPDELTLRSTGVNGEAVRVAEATIYE